jgi:hypothetical protein
VAGSWQGEYESSAPVECEHGDIEIFETAGHEAVAVRCRYLAHRVYDVLVEAWEESKAVFRREIGMHPVEVTPPAAGLAAKSSIWLAWLALVFCLENRDGEASLVEFMGSRQAANSAADHGDFGA